VQEALILAIGELAPVQDAGVIVFIGDDDVVAPDERRDGAEVGLIAGAEDERGFFSHEMGEPPLQFQVQFQRAVEKTGAATAGAKGLQGCDGGLPHFGMHGEPQIVIRADHDQVSAVNDRFRTFIVGDGAEVGVKPGLARRFRLRKSAFAFLEQVHALVPLSWWIKNG